MNRTGQALSRSAALACVVALTGGCAASAAPRSPMPMPDPAPRAGTAGAAGATDATDAAGMAGASQPAGRDAAWRQRHQACLSRMYTQRQYRGRGAPHWPIYDLCMKEQGDTR